MDKLHGYCPQCGHKRATFSRCASATAEWDDDPNPDPQFPEIGGEIDLGDDTHGACDSCGFPGYYREFLHPTPYVVIGLGTRVCTLQGDEDDPDDGTNQMRKAPPGTWGTVVRFNHRAGGVNAWDVEFSTGTWVVLTTTELNDPELYLLAPTPAAPPVAPDPAPLDLTPAEHASLRACLTQYVCDLGNVDHEDAPELAALDAILTRLGGPTPC